MIILLFLKLCCLAFDINTVLATWFFFGFGLFKRYVTKIFHKYSVIFHSQYNVQINWKLISRIRLGGKGYLLLCCYLLVFLVFKICDECESMFISSGDFIWCSSCCYNKGGKWRLNDRKLIVVSLIPFVKLIWNLYFFSYIMTVSLSNFNQASLQNHFKYKMTSFYIHTDGNIDFQKVFDLLLEIFETEKLNLDRMVKIVFMFSNIGFLVERE